MIFMRLIANINKLNGKLYRSSRLKYRPGNKLKSKLRLEQWLQIGRDRCSNKLSKIAKELNKKDMLNIWHSKLLNSKGRGYSSCYRQNKRGLELKLDKQKPKLKQLK